ncbi:frizzled [Contarinia nasturtii]|uniref:frizzled n=1 Tax=Contarinia nasturtii TaxID=265458 RepID=UPI0012D45A37|nr:frizzled [Contarinia nasturtii]
MYRAKVNTIFIKKMSCHLHHHQQKDQQHRLFEPDDEWKCDDDTQRQKHRSRQIIKNHHIYLVGIFSLYIVLLQWSTCHAMHEQTDIVSSGDLSPSMPAHNKCEPITISICKNIPYNMTIMPNLFGHTRQDEAGFEVYQYAPLVKVGCSPDLQFFLCLLYVPLCTILDHPIPPCRSLCESARKCEVVMKNFRIDWPENLECSKFPEDGPGKLCVGQNNSNENDSPTKNTFHPTKVIDSDTRRRNNAPHHSNAGGMTSRNFRFVCPLQLKTPADMGYSLKIDGSETKNCGAPCHALFFKENERTILRYWVGSWAAVCCASCLFTVLTFLIDSSRFRYPERAIVFLAICYLVVGCAYVAGLGAGDSAACREPFPPPIRLNKLPMYSTITMGHRQSTLCTILFMALYFCCMAAFAWWACLALAWFLAAGLKWGHEAIENKSHLFHLIAWAIPALQTICVLALGKVEGDVLSGVCFVGQLDSYSLGVFLLLPLCIYLILGAIFLMAGFTSLFHIRTVMKGDGKRTDKLERLMIRIGFFSGLFILPAIGFLGCLFYEYYNFDAWMLQWNQDMCTKFSIPCPFNSRYQENESRPLFVVFMIKYVCSMLVGVTSSVWLYSGKTVVSWRRFIERLQGTGTANVGLGVNGGANLANGITLGNVGNGTTAGNSKTGTANLVRTRGQAYV